MCFAPASPANLFSFQVAGVVTKCFRVRPQSLKPTPAQQRAAPHPQVGNGRGLPHACQDEGGRRKYIVCLARMFGLGALEQLERCPTRLKEECVCPGKVVSPVPQICFLYGVGPIPFRGRWACPRVCRQHTRACAKILPVAPFLVAPASAAAVLTASAASVGKLRGLGVDGGSGGWRQRCDGCCVPRFCIATVAIDRKKRSILSRREQNGRQTLQKQ